MKARIRNIRAIDDVEIELGDVTLVAGPNGAGKSTIARMIGGCLTGEPLPYEGVGKKDAKLLLLDPDETGGCKVATDEWSATIGLPAAQASSKGTVPSINPIAVGIVHPVDVPVKERAALWATAVRMEPARKDLDDALDEAGLETDNDRLWADIETQGWDVIAQRHQAKAREKKGAWAEVAGETYGEKKAVGWAPENALTNIADAEENLRRVQAEHDAAIGSAAKDAAELDRLQKSKLGLIRKRQERQGLVERLAAADATLATAQAALDEAEKTPAAVIGCYHCSAPLAIMVSAEGVSLADGNGAEAREPGRLKGLRDNKREHESASLALQRQIENLDREIAPLQADTDRLEKIGFNTVDDEKVTTAREALDAARAVLDATKRKVRASKLHEEIQREAAFHKLLGPDGVRKTVTERVLAGVNEDLAAMSKDFGCPTVAVAPDLSISMGERAYELLSESEQFRCRAITQIWLGRGQPLLIIDRADVLDSDGRNGLLMTLARHAASALVMMTVPRPDDRLPDLHDAGIGRTYWLENGRASLFNRHPQREAAE